MTRLYRTDQELNSLTKVRQSHVLYSRFVLNQIQLEGSRRPLRLGSHVMLSKAVEIEALEPNVFTEFPLG